MVSQAIRQGDINAINYFVAIKYVEALKAMVGAPNQKIMLLPMEATGVLDRSPVSPNWPGRAWSSSSQPRRR